MVILNLPARRNQPSLDDIFGVKAAVLQALLQGFAVGRHDEDAHCVWNFLLDLLRSLHIDIEQQIATIALRLFQKTARRTVVVAEHLRIFQKLLLPDHGFKFCA